MAQENSSFIAQVGLGASIDEVDVFCEGDEYKAYGISRRQFGGEPFINFVSKTGSQRGKPWSQIDDIEFDPSVGITLSFIHQVVVIKGQCLDEIYAKLLSQRVVFIREADNAALQLAEDGKTVITSLAIDKRSYSESFDLAEKY